MSDNSNSSSGKSIKGLFAMVGGLYSGWTVYQTTGDALYGVAGLAGSAIGVYAGWSLVGLGAALAGAAVGGVLGGVAGRNAEAAGGGAVILGVASALIGAGVGGYYGYKIPKDLLIEDYNKKKNTSIETSMNAQPVETALESAQQMAQAKGYRLSLA